MSEIWHQNYYRVRKKVLALGSKYWIEDSQGRILGFTAQKLFKLKEDIRVYTDEKKTRELLIIKQAQIVDLWGTFNVIDAESGQILGYIKRKFLKSTFLADEWGVYDAGNNLIGEIKENAGRGLARKYLPGGGLIPEKMVMYNGNVPVVEINQKFKIIGDIWEMQCLDVPNYIDRRVILAGVILMAMIERKNKK